MKYKRLLCLLLVVVMVLGMLSGCGNNQAEQTNPIQETPGTENTSEIINELDIPDLWKQELHHAMELGLPMEKVQQETISGAEMAELLDWFVQYAAPDVSDEWSKQVSELRNSNDALRRIDAMAALYLSAEMIGGDYYGHNANIWHFVQAINHNWDLEETWMTGSLFGEAANVEHYGGSFGNCYLDTAGFYYNAARPSNFSSECPFAFDTESNSFQLSTPLTYADGILAIVRLISSANPDLFIRELTDVDLQYLSMAETRQEEICNTVTDITSSITGTSYYISNDGNDANDGLSPETAWATPYRAMTADLGYGDAVLFERGGTWYISVEENLGDTSRNHGYVDGVTVGAYGEGEKPILRGDIERANNASFWELYYEKDGTKIWKATEALRDSAVIVFNEGEAYAEEVFPWLNSTVEYINPDGTPFIVEDALDKDLTFCNLLLFEDGIESVCNRTDSYVRGELYLRCDAGNPADVYDVVSIPQEPVGLDLFPNGNAYDLSILYFTMMGTQGTDIGTTPENYKFVNLEIGWCGGWVQNYSHQEMGGVSFGYKPNIAGGGIGVYQTELQVLGCHIHHCGPMAMIESIHDHTPDDGNIVQHNNQLFSNNLYEYCGAPFHWTDLSFMEVPGSTALITNMVFEDNLVMNSGYGWIYNSVLQSSEDGANSYWLSAVENAMGAANNEGIYIRDNTFYLSKYALFTLTDYLAGDGQRVNAQPVFSGNTYIQHSNKPLLQKERSTEFYYPCDETVRDVLGDENGSLVIIDR